MDELSATHKHKNLLIRNFFKIKNNLAVKMADLNKGDNILDFGCGAGWFKNNLRKQGYNVTGYDITPEHSDVEDYTELKPDKVFALDVFEHISKEEIREIIHNFKKMNPDFELVTIIPTENLFSRKIRRLLGKSERVSDHITSLREILEVLNSEMRLIRKINFLGISYIGKFKVETN